MLQRTAPRFFAGFLAMLASLLSVVASAGEDFSIEVDETAIVGLETGDVRILMSNSAPLAGWSYGMCHDNTVLTILEVNAGEAMALINDGDGPDFYGIALLEADGGYTVGVIGLGAGLGHLPVGVDQEIELAHYGADVVAPASSLVEPCILGDPTVLITVVEWQTGDDHVPETIGATIAIVNAFSRGDVNGDGVHTLADPLYELDALFEGNVELTCADAADINDDGQLAIDDPIALLNGLFLGGPPPAPPFPDCGADTTGDALDCEIPPNCP